MRSDNFNMRKRKLMEQIQELEDSYAEALSDGTDARSLSAVWERIKTLTREMNETEKRYSGSE